MDELLKQYGQLPESLNDDTQSDYGVAPAGYVGCNADGVSCADFSGCGSEDCGDDNCWGDVGQQPCGDCDDCSDCSDCSDCTDIPKPDPAKSMTAYSTKTTIYGRVTAVSGADYYLVAYRLAQETTATWIEADGLNYEITGLTPGTEYVVNYRGVNDGGHGSVGAGWHVWTKSAGSVYIFDGSWIIATPYIYDGNSWVEHTSMIYDNQYGEWKEGTS